MEDIELVIKIDKEDFRIMKHNIAVNNPLCPLSQEEVVSKIASGIPLPKGHGRLIDADALNEAYTYECISECDRCEHCSKDGHGCELLLNAPTIIEADKTKCEEV